jgi:hypothetical protein
MAGKNRKANVMAFAQKDVEPKPATEQRNNGTNEKRV